MSPTTEWMNQSFYNDFVGDAKRLTQISKDNAVKADGYKLGAQARANRTTYGGVDVAERRTLRNDTIGLLRDAIKLSAIDPEIWRWQELLASLLKASIVEQTSPTVIRPLGVEAIEQLKHAMAANLSKPDPADYDRLKKVEGELRELLRSKTVTVP
jgi:hypothetical protein